MTYFRTVMAQSLFMLKVPLNTKQTNIHHDSCSPTHVCKALIIDTVEWVEGIAVGYVCLSVISHDNSRFGTPRNPYMAAILSPDRHHMFVKH